MATVLSMDELMDIGDAQYERQVESLVAAMPHGDAAARRPPAVLRMDGPNDDAWKTMRAVSKCGGWAPVADVEDETGIRLTASVLMGMSPWVRKCRTGLRLTSSGKAIMRLEAASYAQ